MSWIQENKFTAALAGVTLVGSVALLALTSQKSGELEAANTNLKKALKTESKLNSMKPFPNRENLGAKEKAVDAYQASSKELQDQYMAYKPKAGGLDDMDPKGFSEMVNGYLSRLDAKFKAQNTKLPEGGVYGFGAYSDKLPLEAATGELQYQMKALEWLFSELATNQPEALINVVRPQLAIELGESVAPAPKKRKSKKKSRSSKAKSSKGEALYDEMPLELSFRSTEAQLNSFLAALANSPEYYFVVKVLRVQNETLVPPSAGKAKSSAKIESGSGFESGFEGLSADDSESVEGEAAEAVMTTVASDGDTERLLVPILGQEKLNVFLKLDLLVLKPAEADSSEAMKKN